MFIYLVDRVSNNTFQRYQLYNSSKKWTAFQILMFFDLFPLQKIQIFKQNFSFVG